MRRHLGWILWAFAAAGGGLPHAATAQDGEIIESKPAVALPAFDQAGHSLPHHFRERNEAIIAWLRTHP